MSRAAVTIIATYYRPVLGGAEAAAERLSRYLVRRGHDVLVLTKRTSDTLPVTEVLDGVTVRRLPPTGERNGRGKWAVAPSVLRALFDRQRKPQVMCCVDYRGIGLAALAARAITGVPVIFQAQTEGVLSGDPVRAWVAAPLYRRADALACISHDLEREALAAGVPRDRVHYLPNPVDCERFAPARGAARHALRAELGVSADDVLAVFVGRLSREKGVVELVRAWTQARPAARLVVIGPPMTGHSWDVSEEARALAGRPAATGTISLVGGQPAERVAQWLSVADFAVQPSHFEAMGLAAAEEMAAGLPVIASDTGGYRDFVLPEETGLLVPVRDVDALARAIQRLVADRPLRERMGANARRRAEAFDERVVLERFAELIDRLAERR